MPAPASPAVPRPVPDRNSARPTRVAVWALGLPLAAVVLWLAWRLGHGPAGVAYFAGYVLATVPGWPLGWWLFGRRHAAGWIAGALLGYALTAWSVWAVTAAGLPGNFYRLVGWGALTLLTWGLTFGRRTPLVPLPPWRRRDTLALLVVLWIVPVLEGPAFLNVGAQDGTGTRYYRAYFTADVVWHVALVGEVKRFDLPLHNPYTADRELHYYWTYFLVPPAIAATAPRLFGSDPMPWVLINAVGAGLLFTGTLFLFAWCARPRAALTLAAVGWVFLAASAEGAYVIQLLWRTGQPLSELRQYNIDAATRWVFDGLTVDNLPRSLWYTPQHAAACALGLVALMTAVAQGAACRLPARMLSGIALAAAVTFSPLLGGMLALVYGIAVTCQAVATDWRRAPWWVAGHVVAVVPVVVAVGALIAGGMIEGAGDALHIGFVGYARRHPVGTLLLALGPVILPGLAALWPRRFPVGLVPAAVCLVAGIALFYLGSLPYRDPIWVGWRAGQMMLVALPPLLARTLAFGLSRTRTATLIAASLLAVIGLPTTLVDAYNTQDISNREMGAGFRWTLSLTAPQQEAMRWLQQTTHPSSVVQVDILSRGAETWTLIPTFAQRRMYAGMPISLLYEPEYRRRAALVQRAYATTDAQEAWHIFKDGRVQYVYVDQVERAAFPPTSIAKFDSAPDAFVHVFHNDEADIYLVK